jgi:hypothetical protein
MGWWRPRKTGWLGGVAEELIGRCPKCDSIEIKILNVTLSVATDMETSESSTASLGFIVGNEILKS